MVSSSSKSQVRVQKAAESHTECSRLFFFSQRDNMHTATHNKEYSPGRQFVSTVTIASTGKGRKRGERLNKKKSLQLKIK